MKYEAAPTTMPPAMGACMISLIMILPFTNEDTAKAPRRAAPIPIMTERGPFTKLKVFVVTEASTSWASSGKSVKIMSEPKREDAELKTVEVLSSFC